MTKGGRRARPAAAYASGGAERPSGFAGPASPAGLAGPAGPLCEMRPGSNHKSGVERALVNVRARILSALDALDGEALGEPAERARKELDEADKALRGVELKLQTVRARPSVLLEEHDDTSADTRDWLLQNFTDHNAQAADGNSILHTNAMPSSPSSPERRGRRSSLQEFVVDIQRALEDTEIAGILQNCSHFNFDALALERHPEAGHQLNSIFGVHVVKHRLPIVKDMQENNVIADHSEFMQAWLSFLGRLDTLYVTEATYHGAAHAVDVSATTEWLMQSQYISERMTALDHFMALAAAAMHDVGHPGTNNIYQSKTMSPLAVRYNDRSILENMHVALAFETMQSDPECNWFKLLVGDREDHSANLQQYVRKGLISMVLATDMAKHSGHVKELVTLAEEATEAEDSLVESPLNALKGAEKQKALERKLFLLETVLHAADISNPCKPRPMMLGWTRRVLAEFWAQGDTERELGLEVSPLCDRMAGMASVPKGQLGFITFVVLPFFKPLAQLVEEAVEARDELATNANFWREQDALGASFDSLFGPGGVLEQATVEQVSTAAGAAAA